jgi:lysophospholipase L1-like esterase
MTQRMPAWRQRLLAGVLGVAGLLVVAITAIVVSLRVTPVQTVTVAGQVIKVGATEPSLSLSGPGVVDLFGQSLPTDVRFAGPVRPRLVLSRITIDSELTNFVQDGTPRQASQRLGARLAGGWARYFAWEAAIAGLCALILVGAVAGWRRLPARTSVKVLAVGLVVTELVNVGAIILAARSAQQVLHHVRSLNDLVGGKTTQFKVKTSGPALTGVQVVVMGDSTAAGAGLSTVSDPSKVDRACGRSSESYAEDLARASGWQVMNLACNGATIAHGLLGPQQQHGLTVPPQLGAAMRAQDASAVIVSVGADDVQWSAMVRYCAAAPHCDDRASAAYFKQKLAVFSKNYLQLLTQLAALRGHSRVLINRYYDPFGKDLRCVTSHGLTAANVRTLSSRLATLNEVLSKGAAQFGDLSTQPDFAGHELCSKQPYVQGAGDRAPFHPTALGQFAIALADQTALAAPGG